MQPISSLKTHSQKFASALVLLTLMGVNTEAQIFRWNIESYLVPGTEDVVLEPGIDLDGYELHWAGLEEIDLTGATFRDADLRRASFYKSTVQDVFSCPKLSERGL